MQHTQVILSHRPQGIVKDTDCTLLHHALPQVQPGGVVVQVTYISIDPAMRGWMNEGTTYIKGVALGTVMRAFAVGEVVQSMHPYFAVGDAVQGLMGVQSHYITDGTDIQKVQRQPNIPLSWHLGILGMPGLTAYYGLLDKGKPIAGDVVLVSGAAGMVGSTVLQIAKLKGCKVIGIAGSQSKCNYLTHTLHADAVINYKEDPQLTQLKTLAPTGVNIYFDNVGGTTLDSALLYLAQGARVVICGAIAQYNHAQFTGLHNYMKIVSARATLNGIIVLDYFAQAQDAYHELTQWLIQGNMVYKEHIEQGLHNYTTVLNMLFSGANQGKLVLQP